MIVCLCQGVSEKRVRAAIQAGARTRQQVTATCGAGDGCGGCHRTIKSMIVEHLRREAAAAQVGTSECCPPQVSSAVV